MVSIFSKHNLSLKSTRTYNPGVLFENEKHYLFYAADGKDGISRIHRAVSRDGTNFEENRGLALSPSSEIEQRGLFDPRITKIHNTYYLVYAAYDGDTPRLCLAISPDLENWEKHGPMLENWNFVKACGFLLPSSVSQMRSKNINDWSCAGAIFPKILKMKYWMLFGDRNIWMADSLNGKKWQANKAPLISPRKNSFDSVRVEMGPPPIQTQRGWLVLYHGFDNKNISRPGIVWLDLQDPTKILYRSDKPIFAGLKKFFCNGALLSGDILKIYYGSNNTVACMTEIKLNDLLA
ncbi:MAG: hypothetical protein ABH881_04180 [bacterium]